MKVTILTNSEQSVLETGQDTVQIVIDGKTRFNVSDGEPEDNSLSRNFSDVYGIGSLLLDAYNAGKNKEEFLLEFDTIDEE